MNWHVYVIPFGCIAIVFMLFRLARDWRKTDSLWKKRNIVFASWYTLILLFTYTNRKPELAVLTNIDIAISIPLITYWFMIGGASASAFKTPPKDV